MFEYLSVYDKIIVTGPQRSGTNICARMVASDTGHLFVSEEDLKIDNLDELRRLLKRNIKFVLHAPAYCRYIHELSSRDTFIILMKRDVDEIYASQERIDWCCAREELDKYDAWPVSRRIVDEVALELGTIIPEKLIAPAKYRFWELQKLWIENFAEIEYNNLSEHPMWLDKESRINFTAHQTKVGEIPEFEK